MKNGYIILQIEFGFDQQNMNLLYHYTTDYTAKSKPISVIMSDFCLGINDLLNFCHKFSFNVSG